MSGSTVWLMLAKIFSAISSAISWCGLRPSCDANSLTMIGGLMWMTFCASASTSAGAVEAGAAAGSTVGATGAGGGAAIGPGSRKREMGGRIAARFTAPSPSVRFGFGFFSSIKETDSTGRGGTAGVAGFGATGVFAAGSSRGLVVIGIGALIGGASAGLAFVTADVAAGFEVFAGVAAGFALLVSLRFGSACAAVFDDDVAL